MSKLDFLKNNYLNFRGKSIKNKIVVIESDDWGALRMSSPLAQEKLTEFGVKVFKCPYLSFDSIESQDDLSALFEVLKKHLGADNKPAKFTFNTILRNPDFEKIKESNFQKFYDESFFSSYDRQNNDSKKMRELWNQGQTEFLIHPQFHGLVHLQKSRWLAGLKKGEKESLLAFNLNVLGISTTVTTEIRKSYLPAFDLEVKQDLETHKTDIKTGLSYFKHEFGFHSKSFIAPNYTWNSEIEPVLNENGVRYIQGARAQRSPQLNLNESIIKHYMGDASSNGLIYTVRNVQFEPSFDDRNWVGNALTEVSNAFFWKQPAVISTHRVNYMGTLNLENRNKNLKKLNELLLKITSNWPDVIFMSSDELGEKYYR